MHIYGVTGYEWNSKGSELWVVSIRPRGHSTYSGYSPSLYIQENTDTVHLHMFHEGNSHQGNQWLVL
jgi:hypothetical protein